MIQNKKYGFTLVECLVAISILIVGILSSFILVTRALFNVTVIEQRLTASFLAQEGIELVRNIRDTNFIKGLNGEAISWSSGLSPGKYTIDGSQETISLQPFKNEPLKYNEIQNTYGYKTGKDTPFYREIEIAKVNNNEIKVISHLIWKTKNTEFKLEVEDHLYNWLSI